MFAITDFRLSRTLHGRRSKGQLKYPYPANRISREGTLRCLKGCNWQNSWQVIIAREWTLQQQTI